MGRGPYAVPAGFRPTATVWCEAGEWRGAVDLERRATEIQPLLTYLARPSRTTDRDIPCPAMGWSPPWLLLLDADGRWLSPQLPTDPCGFAPDLFDDRPLPWTDLRYTDAVVRGQEGR